MLSTNKNYTIRISELQAFLTKNLEKLKFSEKGLKQIIKTIKKKDTTIEMRNILYKVCMQKINSKKVIECKYNQLNLDDRIIIELLHTSGFSENMISIFLGRNRSTINREIKKNIIVYEDLNSFKSYKKGLQYIHYYSAEVANKNYIKNRLKCRKMYILEKYPKLAVVVKKLLEKGMLKDKPNFKSTFSPDTIANMSKVGKILDINISIGKSAIYNAAHNNIVGLTINSLPYGMKYNKPEKNKKTESQKTVDKKYRVSIENMPQNIKENKTITHYQGDSVIGKRKGIANTLLTFANPANQFLIIHRSKDKTANSTVDTLNILEKMIPNFTSIMETLLLDNGTEFSNIKSMAKSSKDGRKKRFKIYFAHAYSSYERGCNENKNKMIRKFIPKSTLIEKYTDEEIFQISVIINNTPRKKLGYKTPLELYKEQLKEAGIDSTFLQRYEIKHSENIVS